jgi:hypothetical protein
MHTVFFIICWLWAGWAAFNLLIVLVATVLPVHQAHFDGFRARLPTWLSSLLTADEIAAVISHEHGHRRHLHVWINLALRCLFLNPGARRRRQHEIEADDYAVAHGHGRHLASALRKLSRHPDDVSRAERLERM